MPTPAAAVAHCVLRCSVGTTTVICSTTPSASSSPATRRANAVLPEPGVATARKSRGLAARYRTNARRCQLRRAWVSGAALARTQDSYLVDGQSKAGPMIRWDTGFGVSRYSAVYHLVRIVPAGC